VAKVTDQRRGIWQPKVDSEGRIITDEHGRPVEEWVPTTRQLRRAGFRELVGHATRNGQLVRAAGLSRAERRRRARELWRAGQDAQAR
jgi:hypothetical protein